jgi:hypothetical protein
MKFVRSTRVLASAALLAAVLSPALSPAHAAQADPQAVDAATAALAGGHAAAAKLCPGGYFRVGTNLCMTGELGPDSFANALAVCQSLGGTVAGYGAWRYRILFGDGVMPPVGYWLGPITADNTALFVNQAVPGDFDGETSRFDSRNYVCSKG